MTVRGLARVVDVSASLISQIETGKSSPSVSTLYAITAALDISIEDVFGTVGTGAGRRNGTPEPTDAAVATALAAGALENSAPVQTPGARPGAAPISPTGPGIGDPAAPGGVDRSGESAVTQGLRQLAQKRRVGPVVTPEARE